LGIKQSNREQDATRSANVKFGAQNWVQLTWSLVSQLGNQDTNEWYTVYPGLLVRI